MSPPHAVRFDGSRFWITHRHRDYGPFDYEWSKDFCGVELTYRGQKFGEYCSTDEIYADMRAFRLPQRVVEVSSIVMGCLVYSVLHGNSPAEKQALLQLHLRAHGLDRFADVDASG